LIILAIARQAKRYVYPVQLDEDELGALDAIVERLHSSKSEAIREAIRNYADQLKGTEVIKIREVSRRQARKEILEFLEKNERAWSSEIADSLRIELTLVNRILEELWNEKRVRPTA
jgi:metal-responsive CopG/Arc/MetJ family transcriptional regulator